jgi:hypothetical protein
MGLRCGRAGALMGALQRALIGALDRLIFRRAVRRKRHLRDGALRTPLRLGLQFGVGRP